MTSDDVLREALAYLDELQVRRDEVLLDADFSWTDRVMRFHVWAECDAAGVARWMSEFDCYFLSVGARHERGACVECDDFHAANRAIALTMRSVA